MHHDRTKNGKHEEQKLYKKEDRQKGKVHCSTYLAWFHGASSFGNGFPWLIFIVTMYLVAQVGRTSSDFLLTAWANNPNESSLTLYITITAITCVLLIVRGFLFMYTSVEASKNFHNNVFQVVIHLYRVLLRWILDIGCLLLNFIQLSM